MVLWQQAEAKPFLFLPANFFVLTTRGMYDCKYIHMYIYSTKAKVLTEMNESGIHKSVINL